VKNYLVGVEYFGCHMKVSHRNNKKTRFYTIVQSQTEENVRFRKEVLDYYNKIVVQKVKTTDKITHNSRSETLPLLIKKYDENGRFSKFMHEIVCEDSGFSVTGPYGVGFELRKESQGKHCIFAAGTGIFPFLDLLDYMLRKVIDEVLTETVSKEAADTVNPFNEDYKGTFHPTFSITLYVACSSIEEFVGLDIIQSLSEISKRHNKHWFDCVVKIPGQVKIGELVLSSNRFTVETLSRVVQNNVAKAYICGPPEFNHDMPIMLEKAGLDVKKIVLV